MVMAVSMMSIGTNAYTSQVNWRVSNINSNTSKNYWYTADGYKSYYIKVESFKKKGYNEKVTHYCCYYTKDKVTGQMLYKMCSNHVYSYSSSLEFTADYFSTYIPPFGQDVKACFFLDTSGNEEYEVTATGYLRTNS